MLKCHMPLIPQFFQPVQRYPPFSERKIHFKENYLKYLSSKRAFESAERWIS